MTSPLWSGAGGAVDADVMAFLAGEDAQLDAHLLVDDLHATRAHVDALGAAGLLAPADAAALGAALDDLRRDAERGAFAIPPECEDGHTAIERELTERLGELGRRVHLGRSRNDQVLVALRLHMRRTLDALRDAALAAGRACLARARADERTPMPGYTHLQRAVPSTVGLWMASFAESFADDAALLGLTRDWLDACPLGTAAGYGVNLPLDRDRVAAALGFARLIVNPMAAQASRGKHEHQALAAAWQTAQTVRRLGWDLVLFSSAEFGFVTCPSATTTGSSIMPNKRNPDLAELHRAAASRVEGSLAELQGTLSLPSGYHRDLQMTKPPLLRGLRHALHAVRLVPMLVDGLELHRERMRAAIDGPMHATDRAVELAREGVPFRDAYRRVAGELDALAARTPEASVEARVSPGACADLRLDELAARLAGG